MDWTKNKVLRGLFGAMGGAEVANIKVARDGGVTVTMQGKGYMATRRLADHEVQELFKRSET